VGKYFEGKCTVQRTVVDLYSILIVLTILLDMAKKVKMMIGVSSYIFLRL